MGGVPLWTYERPVFLPTAPTLLSIPSIGVVHFNLPELKTPPHIPSPAGLTQATQNMERPSRIMELIGSCPSMGNFMLLRKSPRTWTNPIAKTV